jgi:hypothetical protein
MNKQTIRLAIAVLLVFALVLAGVRLAAAQEGEIEITGTVQSVGETSFDVLAGEGQTYTIIPEDPDFDFTALEVGDTVEVDGTLNEDGSITATRVQVEEPDEDGEVEGELEDDPSEGYYCRQSEDPHPFGARLGFGYGVEYEELQAWFCDGYGWGQIMLALQTARITGEDFEDLLSWRTEGEGWGQIWQDLGLIGRPEDAGPPNDEDGDGRPDFAGPPNDEDGDGRPDFAGPPNDEDGDGRPDFAGPPDSEENGETGETVPGGGSQESPGGPPFGGPPSGGPGGRP